MTRDEIIRMAREVGLDDFELDNILVRFAALVAAAEREECANLCQAHWLPKMAAAIRARGEK